MKVSILTGSKSDSELAEDAKKLLEEFGVECDYVVLSAHRNSQALDDFIKRGGADVYIAIAGLSAALPGYIASRTEKPVIGVPREVKLLGLDSLLSIVQTPTGIPVACVGIDNSKNAALLAIEILSINDIKLKRKLTEYRIELSRTE